MKWNLGFTHSTENNKNDDNGNDERKKCDSATVHEIYTSTCAMCVVTCMLVIYQEPCKDRQQRSILF
jgi:hypothetical protein